MQEQLRRTGIPAPEVIGVDEISIRKGHSYRIVVSDLLRGRPIWFGGKDRLEESMDLFYQELGARKTKKIRLVVMDIASSLSQVGEKECSGSGHSFR